MAYLTHIDINNEAILIITTLANKSNSYSFKDTLSSKDKISIISQLISLHINKIPIDKLQSPMKNYKMESFQRALEFSVNEYKQIYSSNISLQLKTFLTNCIKTKLLPILTGLYKGQKLLNSLNDIIIDLKLKDIEILNSFLMPAASFGTLITFLFWLGKTKNKNINTYDAKIKATLFVSSIGNSDDRLFKYLLDNVMSNDKLFFQKNSTTIKQMISRLGSSCVPEKYTLRRIKKLSSYISLVPYFKDMIYEFKSHKILIELHKYYYVLPHTFESLSELLSGPIDVIKFEQLYNILKTDYEKALMLIMYSLKGSYNNKFKINKTLFEKVVMENEVQIILLIDWYIFMESQNNCNINKDLLKTLVNNNSFVKYVEFCNKNIHSYLEKYALIFTKFLQCINNNELNKTIISINYVLHRLRLKLKKVSKTKVIDRNIKMFNLLKEIKTFEPKENISILKNGSITYQYAKQKFTNLPPRHLLPGELPIYKNFLLKEKADGILINNLPIGIYPTNDLLNNYQIKAEYIENLDLYLIFDIDIPNTTLIERYNILRGIHSYCNHTHLKEIYSFDEFITIFKEERVQISNFLKENSTQQIKWYPKFASLVNINNGDLTFYKEILDNIILEQNKVINSGLFNCDGIILTPLNGDREIKIKPLTQMTIDLLFENKKWIDRNNYDWTHMIQKTNKKEGRIYRCYPKLNNNILEFVAGDYRYDKKNPNPYQVVDNICNIIKYNWNQELINLKTFYYDKINKITNQKIIKCIASQNELFIKKVNELTPNINKNWLDLGCGKGKLVSIIKKYNPKYYMGLDADINQLVKALKYHDENQNVYNFNPCNLTKKWDDTNINWWSIRSVKFDYIIANFSIMHFFTDIFWTELNNVTESGAKFMFNLVSPNSQNNKLCWMESNSFLEIGDDTTKYKFEWIHDSVKEEPYISDLMVKTTLEKFNWKIISSNKINSNHDLLNYYTWWVIEKI